MDIRAIRTLIRLPALLTGIVIITSSCSSLQKITGYSDAEPTQTVDTSQNFEKISGSIESEEATAHSAYSEQTPVDSGDSFEIRADSPKQYIVVKGDTLWDIASKFLLDPWYWPEIWHRNPQVANPHLIYPGDLLSLIYVNGRPQIQLTRDDVIRQESSDQGKKIVKLTPNIHRQSLDTAIPIIPSDAIRQFLTKPRVISIEEWQQAPYIVGSDDAHLVLGSNNKIYIRGELDKERIRYSVFRKGEILMDPETDEILGYEIIYAGQARITKYGNLSSGTLLANTREVLIGDRLLPTDKSSIEQLYYPKLPENDVEGQVISLFDAISSIAKYQIAVINRGRNQGMENGHLLATYQKGELARDRFLSNKKAKRGEEYKLMVQLPEERSGLMMIFKVFDKVSYGLIIESTRVIRKHDKVAKPR